MHAKRREHRFHFLRDKYFEWCKRAWCLGASNWMELFVVYRYARRTCVLRNLFTQVATFNRFNELLSWFKRKEYWSCKVNKRLVKMRIGRSSLINDHTNDPSHGALQRNSSLRLKLTTAGTGAKCLFGHCSTTYLWEGYLNKKIWHV